MIDITKEDLVKSLIDAGIPEDEAQKMIIKSKEKETEKLETEKLETEKLEDEEKIKKIEKSFSNSFDSFQESFQGKFDSIQKSLEVVDVLKSEVEDLKEQIEKIGNYTPPAKSYNLTEAMIEKAVDSGVKEGDKTHLDTKIHKTLIGDMIGELHEESKGEIRKALEVDLSNLVAGFGELGEVSKRLLLEKKNIIVH